MLYLMWPVMLSLWRLVSLPVLLLLLLMIVRVHLLQLQLPHERICSIGRERNACDLWSLGGRRDLRSLLSIDVEARGERQGGLRSHGCGSRDPSYSGAVFSGRVGVDGRSVGGGIQLGRLRLAQLLLARSGLTGHGSSRERVVQSPAVHALVARHAALPLEPLAAICAHVRLLARV